MDEVLTRSDDSNGASWFAVRTLSRHEKLVREQLARRNVEHFLPTTKRLNQWMDRKKEVEVPLFPGYCFARLRWEDRLQVPGAAVHLYGKSGVRPGRKMGHVTRVFED